MALIELKEITKTYFLGEIDVPVLKGITLSIDRGEYVALMGASGSGKSTLMNILGCLDRQTTGEYLLDGEEVAIARALINHPPVLFADEPTGNLDSKTSEEVMQMFGELNAEGITVILVTHSVEIAAFAKRSIHVQDGRIVSGTYEGKAV